MARKLRSDKYDSRVDKIRYAHLFFAVSTALIITDPLVPGSLTYSNFGGAGAAVVTGVAKLFRPSLSTVLGEPGASSERLPWNAFVIIRGRNREA